MPRKRSREHLIAIASDIMTRSAIEANTLGFMPQFMANTALPTRKQNTNEYIRRNGRYQLSLVSPSHIGLPYGSYPRQIIIYLTTQAKLTQNREIHIGNSQTELLRLMDIKSTGGKTGTTQAFKEQTKRLFACTFLWEFNKEGQWAIESIRLTNKASLTWIPNQSRTWQANILLEKTFFEDIQLQAIPIDLRVIRACTHYPFAMDIYCWLTFRFFSLKTPQLIPWEKLAQQLGNTYKRKSHFIENIDKALKRISLFYPEANYQLTTHGLMLYRSQSHINTIVDKPSG